MNLRFVLLTLVGILALSACAAQPSIQVSDPWVRAAVVTGMAQQGGATAAVSGTDTLMTGGTSAAYLNLTNRGAPDVLLSITTDVAEAAELHTMELQENVMYMRPLAQVELAANTRVQLRPGGMLHLMLIGLRRDLVAGQKVRLRLNFQHAGPIEVEAAVRAP